MPEPKDGEPTEKDLAAQLEAALKDVDKWKALSRKNEERAAENAEKAQKFDESEEKNRTELEKEKARAEKAEKLLADRTAKDDAEKLRADIAKEKKFEDRKIPMSALRGSTREELEAHADELLALFPAPDQAPSADGQGEQGKPIGEGEMTADDIVNAVTTR